jgi:hypothetical protein
MSFKMIFIFLLALSSYSANASVGTDGENNDTFSKNTFSKFTYVANYGANTISLCQIDVTSGTLSNCIATNGGTGGGANGQSGFNGPTGIAFSFGRRR